LDARRRQVAEVRTLREDEERQRRESEANRRNEWEALRQQAAEAQKLREDEERQRKETEARRRNKLGARLQQVAEVRTPREDEERQRREAEANRRNEWEALRQQAAEARIRRESEERQRQEAKAGRRNELEALRQQVAEAIEHRHAEAKRRNELEARRRQAAEEQKASQPLEHQPAKPIGPFRKRLLLRRTFLFAGALPFVILGIEAWIASTQSSPAHVGASQSQRNSAAYFTTNAPAQNRAAALVEQRSDAQPLLQSSTLPVLIADLAKCKMASGGVAIAACSRAIVSGMLTGTDLASAFDRRGILYYAQQDNDSAITDFSEAIRLDPNYASALYARGLAKNEKGDRPSATADIAAAKAIDPNAGKQTVTSARAP
jgi:tetratricopeptide (TPR) repeat protein